MSNCTILVRFGSAENTKYRSRYCTESYEGTTCTIVQKWELRSIHTGSVPLKGCCFMSRDFK